MLCLKLLSYLVKPVKGEELLSFLSVNASSHYTTCEIANIIFNETNYESLKNRSLDLSDVYNTTNSSLSYLKAGTELINLARMSVFTFSMTIEEGYKTFFGDYKDNEVERKIVEPIIHILKIGDFIITLYILIIIASRTFSFLGFFRS